LRLGLAVLFLFSAAAAGCGGHGAWQKNERGEIPFGVAEPQLEREYRLAVGDELALRVSFHDEFDTDAVVRPDGKVTFPLVGEVAAAGRTPSELDSLVTEKFEEFLKDPDVSIVVRKYSDQLVFVLGEVKTPGAYVLTRGMTVTQALAQARGVTEIAKLTDVVLIRRETPYKAEGVKLDIEHFLEDGAFEQDALLKPYDIVYVPRTKIGSMSTFMDSFFRGWTHPLSLIVRGYDLILIERKLD